MNRVFFALMLFLCASSQAIEKQAQINSPIDLKYFPATLNYTAAISEKTKIPNKKKHKVTVSYFAENNDSKALYIESFKRVKIVKNQMDLSLGKGSNKKVGLEKKNKYSSLQEVFANNSEVKMQINIDGINLYPKIGILPAGHSHESGLFLAGKNPSDNDKHWKGFKIKRSKSFFQAIELSEHDYNIYHSENIRTAPYSSEMHGPVLSLPAKSLPAAQVRALAPIEINKPRHEDLFDEKGIKYGTGTKKTDDPLALKSKLDATLSGLRTPPSVGFQGMPNISGFVPPDTEGAVGPLHFVQQINSTTQIFLKDGTPTGAAFNTNTLWSGFGGRCQTDNSGDAIALYDEQADRWVLTQFAVGGSPELVCFAVSQTNDPTGAYHLYSVQTPRFPDYYKLGVWPAANNNAYFMGTNSGTQGAYDVFALDRERMLVGGTARPAQFFQSFPNLLMPADSDGVLPPPDDAPGYLYTIRDGGEPYFGSPPNDSIDIYEFFVDWSVLPNPTASINLAQSFTNSTGLVDFNWTVCGFFTSDCIPQLGTTQLIDSNSWWPQQRLQYRNYGIYGSLVGVWGVNAVAAPAKHTAPRWFELRRYTPDTSWTIRQQGTFAPDANHRFSPSISMDESQNIGLGYSETSSAMFPGISYTVHDNDLDDLGVMEAEAEMFAGLGSQTFAARWGDYASMDVDPTDNCTFWFTTEYIESGNWKTYVGSFMVPGCKEHNILLFDDYTTEHEINVCKVDDFTNYDLALSYDFNTPTTMSVSGCPAGASCNYSASPITYPSTTTLQFTNLSAATSGSYPLTITATDGAAKTDTEVLTLNLQDALVTSPSLISPSNNGFSGSLTPNLSWSAIASSQSYTVEVDNDPGFGSIDFSTTVNGLTNVDTSTLALESCYYWRVTPANLCGNGPNSAVSNFYTPGVQAQTAIASTDVPITIPNTAAPTDHFSTLTVAGIGFINDVNLLNLDITHTYVGDLEMVLISPEGTSVVLMSQAVNNALCAGNNNVDISLDDEAAAGAWPCSPTGNGGNYQPTSPLSAFDGENADGNWTLNVKDSFNGDGGTINGWSLEFENFVDTGNTCPSGFTVGGNVSGLLGSGLVLQNNLGDNLAIATDGGFTFSTSLADTDPYSVTVLTQPNSPSQSCSVTNASGNIPGSDVTNVSVTCTSLPDISFSGTNLTQDVCVSPGPATAITPVTLTTTALNGFNNTVSLAFNPVTLPTGINGGFSVNSFIPAIAPGTDSILNLNVDSGASVGLNTITVDASGAGVSTKSLDIDLNVLLGLTTSPVVSTPVTGTTGVATNTSFTWAAISGATGYDIDIATDAAFSNIVHFATNTASTSYTPGADLLDATIYYWRVRATNTCGNTDYTVSAFETAGGSGLSTTEFCSAANLNLTIPDNDANGVNNILNIIPTGNIQDVNIKVDITHGWVGDIIVGITSPNSPEVLVIDRPGYTGSGNGCSRDNIDTTLDDASATPVENICINNPPNPAIDTGPYSPNNPLISFNNTDLSGNWVINVSDNDNIIEGALNQWCVEATVDSGSPLNPADYSDLASSYGVAKHEGGGAFMLGTNWSADITFGEDSDTGDDGIVATGDWNIGSTINIEATVNIVSGYLSCWFDWNNNGIFDVSENTIAQQQLTSLVTDIPVTVPAGSTFGTNGDEFLETRCRLYDSVQARAPAEPIGTATSGEVEDFRLPASDFTPVSLAYSKALSDNSGFKLDWSTTTEAGALAFNIYGLKGNTWSLLNSQPIATKGINSVVPQDYTFAVSDSQISEYKIEEITTKGSSITYGPFSSNIIHGKYPEVSYINWSSIAEESQSQLTNRIANRGVAADLVKVSVDKTGIQRITYNQLLTAGIDWQGVNSNEISLTFENVAVGRFVSSPVFGPGSYIEFVGLETKTLYTKTNIYELKLEENLVNNAIADASNNYIHDPDAYYMAENMIDNDVKYSFASPTDTPWYFTSMLVRSTSADWSYPLLAPHLINNGVTSHLRFNAWGGTDFPEDNDHHLQVLLNDQVVSDIVTDGLVLISDEVNVDYSLAQNLNSITFRLPADVASAADLIQLDNYSFEYPAEIYTDNDSLQFIPIVNSTLTDVLFADGYETNATTTLNGVANASHGFVAKGFVSDDLKAYAFDGINLIHFPNSAVASGSSGFEISLPHVSSPNMKYFLASDANIIQPSLSLASQTNIDLNGSYDYLMITHPDFVDTLAQLVTYHENNGLRVLVTDVNDIYADYSHHRVDAHAIQSFIADAAFQTGIQSVLIVGGDSYDYLDNLNIGSISFVPTLYYATDDIVKYTPVDALLVDTDNNLIPDLAIGRLPARTSQELQNMIDKILTFDGRNYSDTAVFATDRSSLFDHSSDQMIGELPNDWQVETAYINELEITAAKAKLINSLEAGVSLTSFFGHSGPSTWSFERLFDTNDLALLNNLNKPSLINQFGCWSTYHVAPQYNTMAHGFMELENKGAVSVLGASTLTDSAHESMFGNFLIPLMSQVNMPSGQAIQQAKAALATTNPDYLDVILGWTLLGDPMVILNQE
jgi:subtilisin-like proprotein convertase family protein